MSYQDEKNKLINSKSIKGIVKDEILKYFTSQSRYELYSKSGKGGHVTDLATPDKKVKAFDGVSIGADKNGFFVYTHRARSKSYKTIEDIPNETIKFIESTG